MWRCLLHFSRSRHRLLDSGCQPLLLAVRLVLVDGADLGGLVEFGKALGQGGLNGGPVLGFQFLIQPVLAGVHAGLADAVALAPLEALAALKARYGAWLMIDEAHATGVLGAKGGGLAEALGLTREVDIHLALTS